MNQPEATPKHKGNDGSWHAGSRNKCKKCSPSTARMSVKDRRKKVESMARKAGKSHTAKKAVSTAQRAGRR